MPYSIPVGSIVEVSYRSLIFQQQMMTILHYRYDNTVPIIDGDGAMADLVTALDGVSTITDNYLALLAPQLSLKELRCQVVYPTRQYYHSDARSSNGTWSTGPCTAQNVSAVLVKQSSHAGRGRSGTIHLPAVPDNAYAAGAMGVSGYAAAAATFATALQIPILIAGGPGQWTPVIWSPRKPTSPSEIVGMRLNPWVRTMRRRTVGLGI